MSMVDDLANSELMEVDLRWFCEDECLKILVMGVLQESDPCFEETKHDI